MQHEWILLFRFGVRTFTYRLKSLAEIYFSARENAEDNVDSASDFSGSDNEDNLEEEDEVVELMEVHTTERTKVRKFYTKTCKCKLGTEEQTCITTLTLDDFTECRNNCNELSSMELDLVILGNILKLVKL